MESPMSVLFCFVLLCFVFNQYDPRPPETFYVIRPGGGGSCCDPLPGFSIFNAQYPYVCYQCKAMGFFFPLIPKKIPSFFV